MPSSAHQTLRYLKTSPKHAAISLEEFSTQLEIDLTLFGNKKAFRKRLFLGLNAAYLQGIGIHSKK